MFHRSWRGRASYAEGSIKTSNRLRPVYPGTGQHTGGWFGVKWVGVKSFDQKVMHRPVKSSTGEAGGKSRRLARHDRTSMFHRQLERSVVSSSKEETVGFIGQAMCESKFLYSSAIRSLV